MRFRRGLEWLCSCRSSPLSILPSWDSFIGRCNGDGCALHLSILPSWDSKISPSAKITVVDETFQFSLHEIPADKYYRIATCCSQTFNSPFMRFPQDGRQATPVRPDDFQFSLHEILVAYGIDRFRATPSPSFNSPFMRFSETEGPKPSLQNLSILPSWDSIYQKGINWIVPVSFQFSLHEIPEVKKRGRMERSTSLSILPSWDSEGEAHHLFGEAQVFQFSLHEIPSSGFVKAPTNSPIFQFSLHEIQGVPRAPRRGRFSRYLLSILPSWDSLRGKRTWRKLTARFQFSLHEILADELKDDPYALEALNFQFSLHEILSRRASRTARRSSSLSILPSWDS